MNFQGEPPPAMSGQDKNALITTVVDRAVDKLSSGEKETEKETRPGEAGMAEFRKIASSGRLTIDAFEKFLNDNRFNWFYAGGYAYYRWCQHYGLPSVDYNDYDVIIDPADYEKALLLMYGPHRGEDEQWQIGGKEISLVPNDASRPKQLIGTSWLAAPAEIARTYGSGSTTEGNTEKWNPRKKGATAVQGDFLADIRKGRTGGESVEEKRKREAKEQVRGLRKAGMPELYKKYDAEFPS